MNAKRAREKSKLLCLCGDITLCGDANIADEENIADVDSRFAPRGAPHRLSAPTFSVAASWALLLIPIAAPETAEQGEKQKGGNDDDDCAREK